MKTNFFKAALLVGALAVHLLHVRKTMTTTPTQACKMLSMLQKAL
jgi:hypothetical protein